MIEIIVKKVRTAIMFKVKDGFTYAMWKLIEIYSCEARASLGKTSTATSYIS